MTLDVSKLVSKQFVKLFFFTCVPLLVIDALWVTFIAYPLYDKNVTSIAIWPPRILPTLAFYDVYIALVTWLVVQPAFEINSPKHTLWTGATVGALICAVHGFCNLAIITDWTWTIALHDIVWGAVSTAAASYVAVTVAIKFMPNSDPATVTAVPTYQSV